MPNGRALLERLAKWLGSLQKSTRYAVLLGVLAVLVVLFGMLVKTPAAEQDSFLYLGIDVTIKLVVVLMLIYIAAAVLRRWGLGTMSNGRTRQLRIREMLPLSPRRALYLVQAGKQSLLIGATDQSMTLIAELDLPVEEEICVSNE